MKCRIIEPTAAELGSTNPCEFYEREIRAALSEGYTGIAVCLRPEMGACVELVEWLANWQAVIVQQGSLFVVVATDERQLQYLDLSHPDEEVSFVTSVEELWKRFPDFRPPKPQQPQPQAPAGALSSTDTQIPVESPDVAQQSQPAEPPLKSAPPQPQVQAPLSSPPQKTAPDERAAQTERIKPGETITLSGEYSCSGCNATRMYAKGDCATECTNPECMNPRVGWRLVFELF